MSFRFSIDGKVYDLVDSNQSGQLIHQQRVPFQHQHDIHRFVDQLLAQNGHKIGELQSYLSLPNQEQPRDALTNHLQKGRFVVQSGSVAHLGGPARAPAAPSRHEPTEPSSSIYSDTMLRQLAQVAGEAPRNSPDFDKHSNSGGSAKASNRPISSTVADATNKHIAATTESAAHDTPTNKETHYKICVEVAGRARCFKQRLEINAINGGATPGEGKQLQSAGFDHKQPHRCLIEFRDLPNTPRDLTLVISTKGSVSDIRLPLVQGHGVTDKKTTKAEWDTVLVPVKPLAYINKARNRQQADVLKPGYVYVFWLGKLWRELAVSKTQALKDINVAFYRNHWNGDLEQTLSREADGHWISDIWLPYKINGVDLSGQLYLLYSETQLDLPYIESLENNTAKLKAKATALNALSQYSNQQHFECAEGDITAIKTALLDQAIDPALGYDVISEKGHHLNRARHQNIPTAYMVPAGEKFVLQVEDENGRPFRNRTITLHHGDNAIEATTDSNGVVEISLLSPLSQGELILDLGDELPKHRLPFESTPAQLDDVSTIKGQQLRLNNLGFNAGVVDGINGRRTKSAARAFQKDQRLDIDGIIGPMTQSALTKAYGQ